MVLLLHYQVLLLHKHHPVGFGLSTMGPRRPGNCRHTRPGVSKHPDMANTEGGPPSSNKQTMSTFWTLKFKIRKFKLWNIESDNYKLSMNYKQEEIINIVSILFVQLYWDYGIIANTVDLNFIWLEKLKTDKAEGLYRVCTCLIKKKPGEFRCFHT